MKSKNILFFALAALTIFFLSAACGAKNDQNPKQEEGVMEYKKSTEEKLKQKLTPLQYAVTQKDGTEQAFNNDYWDNKEAGIYVDIVSGEPLLVLLTNLNPEPDGLAFLNRLNLEILSKRQIIVFLWIELK